MWLEWGPRRNEACTVCVLCSLLHHDSVLCRLLSQQGDSEGLTEGCWWKPHHHLPPATGGQTAGHSDPGEGHSDPGEGHSDPGEGHSDPGEGHTAAAEGHSDPGERAGKSCDSFSLVSIDSSSPSDNGGLYSDSSHWLWFWTVGWQQGVLTYLWHHTDPVSDSRVKNSILTYLWCHHDPDCRQWGDRTASWPTCDVTLILAADSTVTEQGILNHLWCHPDPGCRQQGDRTGHYDLLVTSPWPWLQTAGWQNRALWPTCDITLTLAVDSGVTEQGIVTYLWHHPEQGTVTSLWLWSGLMERVVCRQTAHHWWVYAVEVSFVHSMIPVQ